MAYVRFRLGGDIALWRNHFEPVGSFSALGPAPSQIAGILGAAMGLASPRSVAGTEEEESLRKAERNGLWWPVSSELLRWQVENDYAVACRWCEGFPRRIQWNVNGLKAMRGGDSAVNLRITQTVLDRPSYEILVRVNNDASTEKLSQSLRSPRFPLYLGTSFCRGFVEDIETLSEPKASDEGPSWAYWVERLTFGEAVPFSRHVTNDRESGERIHTDGYWIYPTPANEEVPEGALGGDPCVRGYVNLE